MQLLQLVFGLTCLLACQCEDSNLEYDFIVVGVGSGGSIMASRLSEPDQNWTVLALDRGSAIKIETENDLSGLHDPNYFSIAQEYLRDRLVRNPRYYGLGGTAMINGMTAVAPSRSLLDQWWPNGWKWNDLLPYMLKMQNHYCFYLPSSLTGISDADCRTWHNNQGPIDIAPPLFQNISEPVLDLMRECNETVGFTNDYNNPTRKFGCYFQQQFRKPSNKSDPNSASTRASTWAAYLKDIQRSNLQILEGATVLKLLFDDRNRTKCIGVLYGYHEQIYRATAKKEVILAAGVFDTPKLLQLSGVGPKQWLDPLGIDLIADNPHVGTNLVDQMALYTAFETKEQLPSLPWGADTCGWLLNSQLKEDYANWTDIQIYCYSQYPIVTLDFPIVGSDPTLAYSNPPITFVTFLVFNVLPDASGIVKIQSLSPYDRPYIDHGWHNLSEYDQQNLQYGVNYIRNLTVNTRWGQRYIKQELYPGNRYGGSDDLHRRLGLSSAYHQVGTCGLGKCTDLEARVMGIDHVRICDTSLFPTQLNINPTFTLYSMCEKVADLVKHQYAHNRSDTGTGTRFHFDSFIFFWVTLFLILFKYRC